MKFNTISLSLITLAAFCPSSYASVIDDIVSDSKHELQGFLYHFNQGSSDNSLDRRRNHALISVETKSSASVGEQSYFNLELLTFLHTMKSNHDGFVHPFERDSVYSAVLSPKVASITYEDDTFDLSGGIDLVNFGFGELHNSVSNFGRVNSLHPGHSYDQGVIMARYRHYLDDDTLSYTVMPIDMVSPHPVESNRWKGIGSTGYPSLPDGSSVADIETTAIDIKMKNIRHLVQYDAIRSGYDYYGFAALGPSPYSVIRQVRLGEYERFNPLALQIGAGVDTVYGSHKLYTDIMYQHTDNLLDENFIRGTVGGIFKESIWVKNYGINEISLTTEYAFDVITQKQNDKSDLIFSSEESRSGRNTLLGRIEFDIDNYWKASLGSTYNLTDNDRSDSLGIRYKENDSLKLYFVGTRFKGDDGSQFGAQRENDLIELGFKISF